MRSILQLPEDLLGTSWNSICRGVLPRATREIFLYEDDLASCFLLGEDRSSAKKPMWRITRSFTVNGSGKQEQLKRKKANGTVQQRPLWSHLRLSVE